MQKILITSGGTEEPIDGVRTISNFSTGKTGVVLAEFFYNHGFDVTLVAAQRAFKPHSNIRVKTYGSFNELNQLLQEELRDNHYTAVIHAAAVSDYSVDYLLSGEEKLYVNNDIKIDSSKPLSIVLKPNFKILNRLKEYSSEDITIIGFKLTKNADNILINEKLAKIFQGEGVDFVVQNDLSSINDHQHITNIYNTDGLISTNSTKEALAEALVHIVEAGGRI